MATSRESGTDQDIVQYEYCVDFRRLNWRRTTRNGRRKFESLATAYEFVARLNRDLCGRGLSRATWRIERRLVGQWSTFEGGASQ